MRRVVINLIRRTGLSSIPRSVISPWVSKPQRAALGVSRSKPDGDIGLHFFVQKFSKFVRVPRRVLATEK